MSTMNDSTRLVEDLAAHWTDPALAILKAAGIQRISLEMELQTWRILTEVLQSELRWQRAFRLSTLVSLGTLTEQVLDKAILLAARRFAPDLISADVESRIRGLVRDRRTTTAEHRLYAALVRQPAMRSAFKPASRTDYFPRLRASSLVG